MKFLERVWDAFVANAERTAKIEEAMNQGFRPDQMRPGESYSAALYRLAVDSVDNPSLHSSPSRESDDVFDEEYEDEHALADAVDMEPYWVSEWTDDGSTVTRHEILRTSRDTV